MAGSPSDLADLLEEIRILHDELRDLVVHECSRQSVEQLSREVGHEGGDTIFAIDRVPEARLVEQFTRLSRRWPMTLVAEGLGATGTVTLADGATPRIRVVVDPIDGTRELMYQKRPAWILTAVAPERGAGTSLADVELAVMTEIPLLNQHLSDQMWAMRGEGVTAIRHDRLSGESVPFSPRPSQADTIAGGFGAVCRFFPGARDVLAAIDDELVARLAGDAVVFEDQYLSSAGQLAELIRGHDRWVADLRPLVIPGAMACHPYDLCVELIAREAGVVVSDPWGRSLNAPLDVHTAVAWIGAANAAIHSGLISALRSVLAAHGITD